MRTDSENNQAIQLNKSYDFRQGLSGQLKNKNIKLDLAQEIEEAANEETGKAKIIYNNRQVRRLSNNYVKPTNNPLTLSPDYVNSKAGNIIKLGNNRKITPVGSKGTTPIGANEEIGLSIAAAKTANYFTHQPNSPVNQSRRLTGKHGAVGTSHNALRQSSDSTRH